MKWLISYLLLLQNKKKLKSFNNLKICTKEGKTKNGKQTDEQGIDDWIFLSHKFQTCSLQTEDDKKTHQP